MRSVGLLFATLMLGTAGAGVAAEGAPALVPFSVDHGKAAQSPISLAGSMTGPAGEDGFVSVRDGHFVDGTGKRFRCWGVNLTGWTPGSALLPAHADAETTAATLARLGVNCVRLHFLDMPKAQTVHAGLSASGDPEPTTLSPSGLIDGRTADGRAFDPDQVDRLHYLFSRLKAHGIHVDFNLNVGRSYPAGSGIPDAVLIGNAKGMTFIGDELIARQKEYARTLLTMRNPYTGLRYVDDPAVVIVEIVNENSLLEFWQRNWLRGERVPGGDNLQLDLTPHYKAVLMAKYDAWLTSHRSAAERAELRRIAGVAAGQPVPLMRRGDFEAAPRLRLDAEIAFITDIEIGYFNDMRDFLRRDLGVKSIIIPNADHSYFIAGQPMMRTAARFDVLDSHVYWQHPAIYGKRNEPMVNTPELSIAVKLARTAMTGKAFTVSEVNHPFPSDYGAEMIPLLASYAALQDWDGIFFYTFESKNTGESKTSGKSTGIIGDHFDITLDPVKIAQLPVGAMIFQRGDVHAAKTVVERALSTDQINESARMSRNAQPYFDASFPLTLPLRHGSRVACLDCAARPATMPDAVGKSGDPIASDTRELVWRRGPDGLVTIDSERTQGLVGFIPANGRATRHLGADIANRFAAITLSALDDQPVRRSGRLLLTTTGQSQNSGATWNERRTMLTKWGSAPTLIEPIRGWIQLRDLDGALGVYVTPLDGAAMPAGAERPGRMIEAGWEIPVGDPAATSYLVRVAR